MANSIEFAKNYTGILDEVYQRAAVSRCLKSGGRKIRAGCNAKEILIPKISETGLGGLCEASHKVSFLAVDTPLLICENVVFRVEREKALRFESYSHSTRSKRPPCL